jgi:hypothetical protein
MKATRPMTKSPLRPAETALAVAREALPPYATRYDRKAYTQHRLFAILALRASLKQDYRGTEQLLKGWPDLRQALALAKAPDHSALQKAAQRLPEKRGPMPCSTRPWHRPGGAA